MAVPVGRQTTTVFDRVHQNAAQGGSLLSTIDLFVYLYVVVSNGTGDGGDGKLSTVFQLVNQLMYVEKTSHSLSNFV